MAHIRPATLLVIVAFCLLSYLQPTTSVNSTVPLMIDEFVKDVGPNKVVDFVMVVDRSQGMSIERFILVLHKLTGAILKQYAVIHPDFTRTAVITFGADSQVIFDYISDKTRTKCAVFGGDSPTPWEKVMYIRNDTYAKGTNLKAAFKQANNILTTGKSKRPSAKQIIVLATDGDYTTRDDPINEVNALKDKDVTIFAVGIGNWLKPGNVRILASKEGYYGTQEQWTDMLMKTKPTSFSTDTPPLWVDDEPEVCNKSCGAHAQCQCDVLRGVSQCMCHKGYYLKDGNCIECASNTYKSEIDNQACEQCPQLMVTSSNASDAVDQCKCPENITCTDPCKPNPCDSNEVCQRNGASYKCECQKGWSGDNCSTNADDCLNNNACQHGASCVDMLGDFTCVCKWGFQGRYCELNIDECKQEKSLCRNGATCKDMANNFNCACTKGWIGRFCQDVDKSISTTPGITTPETTTPTTTPILVPDVPNPETTVRPEPTATEPKSGTTQSAVSPPEKKGLALWIIIACACGGGLLVLILIVIIVATRRRRRRKEEPELEKPAANGLQNGGKMSSKFSGFWKMKTVRGAPGMRDLDEDTNTIGRPSVPVSKKCDMETTGDDDGEAVMMVEEAMYSNTQIIDESAVGSTMMDGWNKYLQELVQSGTVERAVIIRPDGTSQAKTDSWLVDLHEIDKIQVLLEDKSVDVPAVVQGGEYHIRYNDGTAAGGQTIGSGSSASIMAITRTKNYVLIATASAADDEGECRKELDWIGDHIRNEGY